MKKLSGRSIHNLVFTVLCASALGYACSSDTQEVGPGASGSGPGPTNQGGSGPSDPVNQGGTPTQPTNQGGTSGEPGAGGTPAYDANLDGFPDLPPAESSFASDLDYWCRNPDFDFPVCTDQDPTGGPNTDPSCDTSESSSGDPCTQDCLAGCGFRRLGAELCTCDPVTGLYANCRCTKGSKYGGAATAPPCDTIEESGGSNDIFVLDPPGSDSLPCDTVWEQCIGIDPANPLADPPRGCVCMPAINTNLEFDMSQLNWVCGSTNRWFAPQL